MTLSTIDYCKSTFYSHARNFREIRVGLVVENVTRREPVVVVITRWV